MELYCTFRDEQPYKQYSDHQSFVGNHAARNEGGQTKERERAMESKQRHRHDVVHGDICRAPEFVDRATVTARLRFSLLHSKTVTLSSQSSPLEVHGASIPRFTFRTNRKGYSRVIPFGLLAGNCALLGLKWMSNVDTSLMSISQTAITAAFNGTSRLTRQASAPIKIRVHYETITVCS